MDNKLDNNIYLEIHEEKGALMLSGFYISVRARPFPSMPFISVPCSLTSGLTGSVRKDFTVDAADEVGRR